MEKARPIPEPQLDEHYFEDDDDDDYDQMEIVFLPDEKAHRISEPELEEEKHYFEEDDDDDDQVEIDFLPDEQAHRISEPELEEEELYFEEDDDEDDDQVDIESSFPTSLFHQLMKARRIPEPELEEEEHYFEDDDDDEDHQVEIEISFPNKPLPPMPRKLMEMARPIPELELKEAEHHFEEDDDDQVEIVFLPDDHLPPSAKTATISVPPPLHSRSRKMYSDPEPEEPCQDRPALRRGPSVGLQDLKVPARSFEPVRTLPSSASQVLQQRDLRVPARSFEPELLGGTRFEI
jgi:hypothetical protein